MKIITEEVMFKLVRHHNNPILAPHPDFPWEKEGVLNPGVIKNDDEIIMLYRAVGERDAYISHLGLAKSTDGISFTRASSQPVFNPSETFDMWSTEDPRITKIDDTFYVTYVAVPDRIMDHNHAIDRALPLQTSTALLETTDFLHYKNHGVISPTYSDNKDTVLFPKKIQGRYAMLHRPNHWDKSWFLTEYATKITSPLPCPKDKLPLLPSIWISWSTDLVTWTDHEMLLSPSHTGDAKIGAGLPPLETSEGWIMIYHHVEILAPGLFKYSVRAALLDLENPQIIKAKIPYDILTPEMPYETEQGTHIVFPSGGYISNDTLFVYYGAGDRYIGLATGSRSELLEEFKRWGPAGQPNYETSLLS